MTLNRELQFKILNALADTYPDSLLVSSLPQFNEERVYMANLFYLKEHGLIDGGDIREPGLCRSMVDAQITCKGLDFLANDGGVSALLHRFIKFEVEELVEALARSDAFSEVLRSADTVSLKKGVVEVLNQVGEEKEEDLILLFKGK